MKISLKVLIWGKSPCFPLCMCFCEPTYPPTKNPGYAPAESGVDVGVCRNFFKCLVYKCKHNLLIIIPDRVKDMTSELFDHHSSSFHSIPPTSVAWQIDFSLFFVFYWLNLVKLKRNKRGSPIWLLDVSSLSISFCVVSIGSVSVERPLAIKKKTFLSRLFFQCDSNFRHGLYF